MTKYTYFLFISLIGLVLSSFAVKQDTRQALLEKKQHIRPEQEQQLIQQRRTRLEEALKATTDPVQIKEIQARLARLKKGKLQAKDIKHELQKDLSTEQRTELRAGKIDRLVKKLKKASGPERAALEEKIKKLQGKVAAGQTEAETPAKPQAQIKPETPVEPKAQKPQFSFWSFFTRSK